MNEATIRIIKNIRNHPNADNLSIGNIDGWQVIFLKNEFQENELVVYVSYDSEMPALSWNSKFWNSKTPNKPIRIRSIKLRGEISTGICFPMSILPSSCWEGLSYPRVGEDVSEVLGIVHYEKPVPACLAGTVMGHRPSFIKKTDELNLRSYPHMVDAMKGLPYYITQKCDGSSGTYFIKNGEFGVCSRNLQLQKDENNQFWKMVQKYPIENAFQKLGSIFDVAIQAEIVGPSIQDNHLGFKEVELRVFNLINLQTGELLSFDSLVSFCKDINIPMVEVIETGESFNYTLDDLLKIANSQKYSNGQFAEGIVVRPKNYTPYHAENVAWNALSGKVLNENFKDKE